MPRVINKDSDLEKFWLQEIGKIASLSYRLQILLLVRKTFPTDVFIDMVNNEKFLEALDIFDSRLRKWASHGESPSEDMVKAFALLLAGRPFEDVKEEVLEEAMSRPTNQNRSYEKEKELTGRKRTVKRTIYRAKDYLKAAGFQVKHRSPLSPEFEQFRKMVKSSAPKLEEEPYGDIKALFAEASARLTDSWETPYSSASSRRLLVFLWARSSGHKFAGSL